MGPAIHAAQHNSCVGHCHSHRRTRPRRFRRWSGDIKIYTSYDELLADPNIDAIYIPLPNHLHIEWSKRAARAGKHVLCEKPIALRADQIDELIALRDETGLMIAEAFMITHHPQWIYARELLAQGAIGTLMQVDGVFSYNNVA
jgi:predicted dehydrogenase